MKIILGSKSAGRKLVLERAGYNFDILTADIDEKAIRTDDYEKLPLLIAREKAKAILPKIKESAILITSDQVVVCNGELREKPENEEEARRFLESYAQYPAQTNTAVVVTNTETGKQAEGVDIAKAYFKAIPEDVVDKVLLEGKVMHAAGGYIVEDPTISLYVDHIEGEKNSVTGLPLKLTEKLMAEVK